ncbi:hypothetical protein [Pseudoalteromonas sp. 68 DY56-GL68]|jgi:uncharacterized membrane protein|uniref:hypothetical protein n=1 Tax=Pseudoalteromonas sp. 68 DY56-GL68 TaxID=2974919 RepID=UPI003529E3A0
MNVIYLLIAIMLLITSSLLLRNTKKSHSYIALCLFGGANIPLIILYGAIGGIFISIASFLVIGLFTALIMGKAQ